MIHFRFKFPKIGAQSGIELSLTRMGDRGCGGVLGGNANIINTPPHVRGPMGEHIRNPARNAAWCSRNKFKSIRPRGAERAGGVPRHRTNNARTGVHRDTQEHEILRTVASLERYHAEQMLRPDRALDFRLVLTAKRRRDERGLAHGRSR